MLSCVSILFGPRLNTPGFFLKGMKSIDSLSKLYRYSCSVRISIISYGNLENTTSNPFERLRVLWHSAKPDKLQLVTNSHCISEVLQKAPPFHLHRLLRCNTLKKNIFLNNSLLYDLYKGHSLNALSGTNPVLLF